MSPSTRFGRLSPYRLVVLLGFLAVFGVGITFTDEPLSPTVLVMGLLVTVYLLVSAFDSVREHPLFDVANAAWLTVLFILWYVSTDESVVVLAFAVLAAFGTLVEAYNYRNDTSYLRIDF
jgi:hypothetical protein